MHTLLFAPYKSRWSTCYGDATGVQRPFKYSHEDKRKHYPKQNTPYSLYGGSVYEEADQQTLDLIWKSIPQGCDILELGGGDFRYGIPMTRLGFTVLSGDYDHEALRIAKKKALLENARSAVEIILDTTQRLRDIPHNLRKRPRVKPVKLNVFENFPYQDGRFHGVVSTALLYLFPENDIQKVIDESRRVLNTCLRFSYQSMC
jgi:hypothetical protein